jgi:hypothetical protein
MPAPEPRSGGDGGSERGRSGGARYPWRVGVRIHASAGAKEQRRRREGRTAGDQEVCAEPAPGDPSRDLVSPLCVVSDAFMRHRRRLPASAVLPEPGAPFTGSSFRKPVPDTFSLSRNSASTSPGICIRTRKSRAMRREGPRRCRSPALPCLGMATAGQRLSEGLGSGFLVHVVEDLPEQTAALLRLARTTKLLGFAEVFLRVVQAKSEGGRHPDLHPSHELIALAHPRRLSGAYLNGRRALRAGLGRGEGRTAADSPDRQRDGGHW